MDFAERVLGYLDKAEESLEAGETDKASAYTAMAKIAVEIAGMPGANRLLRNAPARTTDNRGGRGRPGNPPTEPTPPDGP